MVEENLVGKKLGDYILREKLTSGGMAHIYLGDDEKLQRRAAIKILTSDLAGNDEILRERFEREARAVARLEHDSIVPIYQFGEEGNLYFIAMRYIEGNDLADEMKTYKQREEKMPVTRMLSIMEQVASALDHAHKRGIIHRDVKPSNVLLLKDTEEKGDKAVLTDFGLVLWEDVDKTLGTAFGTPRYISPEQATDSQSALPQSDIYSLAVIVYEILTGEVLFKGNTPMEVALSHITEPPKPPRAHNPDIPAEAQREILKALQKDSSKRHTSATRFIDALKEAYNMQDTGTKPPSARPQKSENTSATKPLRDDATTPVNVWKEFEKSADAPPEKIQASIPKVTPATVVQPLSKRNDAIKETASEGKLPIAVLGGGLIVIVGIIAAIYFALSGNTGGLLTDNANMEIRYNEDFFAIANTSENATLDISALIVIGDSGTTGGNFGTQLAPSDCRFVRRSSAQDSNIPDAWNCDGTAIRVESSDDLYWRAEDATDESFTVENGNSLVQTCDTAGRAVGNAGESTCSIAWPTYTTNEE
ncbi:MAG: serine/threonine-protein kinase [Phototrophicaceae bacterium]